MIEPSLPVDAVGAPPMTATPLIRRLEVTGSTLRVAWPDELRSALPRDLVITWPSSVDLEAIPRPLLIAAAAYAAAPVAWAVGGSWTVPGMERRMAASLEPLREAIAHMIPGHDWPGRIETPEPIEVPPSGAGPMTALLFTTGVDSMHEAIAEPAPLLLFSVVLDDDDPARTTAQMAEADRFATRFGHRHVQARASVRSMVDRAEMRRRVPVVDDWWPEVSHGMELAAAATPIAWLHGADRLLVGSSDLPPFASVGGTDEHLVDRILAGPAQAENRALGVSRMAKIATLVDWSERMEYQPWFRICVRPAPPDRPNCGRCERCLRTQVNLVLAGGDPRRFGWPEFSDALLEQVVDTFPKWSQRLDRGAVALQWQAVAEHARQHPRPPIGPGDARLRAWLQTVDFTPYGRGGPLAGKRGPAVGHPGRPGHRRGHPIGMVRRLAGHVRRLPRPRRGA